MDTVFLDYFRCPEQIGETSVGAAVSTSFFQSGRDIARFGQFAGTAPANQNPDLLIDTSHLARFENGRIDLPFDLSEVVNNLRYERYASHCHSSLSRVTGSNMVRRAYYFLRPVLSVSMRKHLQRMRLRRWDEITFPHWPVDFSVESLMESTLALVLKARGTKAVPFIWFWPNGASSCVTLTHDVEGEEGRSFCNQLMNFDDRFGIKSSFQIIPEARYATPIGFLHAFRERGFEVNVHDLNHDGALFCDRREFARRARRINKFAREFGAVGFRSGAMYRNQDWYDAFEFSYDMSVPNVAHLEPQRGGCCTVMPYFIGKILELPLTTIQDYSLFHILGDYSINLWKRQAELIMQRHGLISFITHPDYLIEKRAQKTYLDLLSYLSDLRKQQNLWVALPSEINTWWRSRQQMRLVPDGHKWRIEGPGSERARVAYATLDGDRIVYSVESVIPVRLSTFTPRAAALPEPLIEPALPTKKAGQLRIRSPRKICMLAYTPYEADNRVRRYAEALAKQGDQVDVIALAMGDVPLGAEKLSGVTVHRIQRRDAGEQHKWDYLRQLLRFLMVSSFFLARRHHRVRYDLIHVHNVPDFLVFAAWYPKWRGAKLILDIHDIVPELFESKFGDKEASVYVRLLKRVEQLSANFVDHVIVSNDIWLDKLVSRSAPRTKCSVFLNHVDPAIFFRRARTRQDGKIIILFPGSFQWHQGLDIAIRAFALFTDRFPNAELHLCGGGTEENRLRDLVDELGLGPKVQISGLVSLDQIANIIVNADLGIVPKRANSFGNEAYSTKIMEFMSQGVPVVASRTKIDSLYFDDTVVRFFPSGDAEAMAKAMIEVIENAALREALIKRGYEYAERHSWARRKLAYLALVDSLLAGRPTDLPAETQANEGEAPLFVSPLGSEPSSETVVPQSVA